MNKQNVHQRNNNLPGRAGCQQKASEVHWVIVIKSWVWWYCCKGWHSFRHRAMQRPGALCRTAGVFCLWPVLHMRQPFSRRGTKCFTAGLTWHTDVLVLACGNSSSEDRSQQPTYHSHTSLCVSLPVKTALALTSQGNWNHHKALVQC